MDIQQTSDHFLTSFKQFKINFSKGKNDKFLNRKFIAVTFANESMKP